ncbi:hypothetical protein HYT56_04275 [Candidatus Woesearchaeota archaeon]|nr:hypothetical protein [Candidatus Woesearchaeota archaeon]
MNKDNEVPRSVERFIKRAEERIESLREKYDVEKNCNFDDITGTLFSQVQGFTQIFKSRDGNSWRDKRDSIVAPAVALNGYLNVLERNPEFARAEFDNRIGPYFRDIRDLWNEGKVQHYQLKYAQETSERLK